MIKDFMNLATDLKVGRSVRHSLEDGFNVKFEVEFSEPYVYPETFRNIYPQISNSHSIRNSVTLTEFYFWCLMDGNVKVLLSEAQMREACEYLFASPFSGQGDIEMSVRAERMLDCYNLPYDMFVKILDVVESKKLVDVHGDGLTYRIVSHPQVTTEVLLRLMEMSKEHNNVKEVRQSMVNALETLLQKPYRLDFKPKKGWDNPNKKELKQAYVMNQNIIKALESVVNIN